MFSGARERGRPAWVAECTASYPLRFAPYVRQRVRIPHPLARSAGAAARTGTLLAVAAAVHQVVNLRALREPAAQPPPVAEPVSVLVPARDEAARIAPTIRSLLAQTGVAELEILVLDDESGDGTAATVRAVAAARSPALMRMLQDDGWGFYRLGVQTSATEPLTDPLEEE